MAKVVDWIARGAAQGCELIIFGEALVPGYPFWIERTNGAEFNSPVQKEIHAHYLANAVQIEAGHLIPLTDLAREKKMAVYLGCIERPSDRVARRRRDRRRAARAPGDRASARRSRPARWRGPAGAARSSTSCTPISATPRTWAI